MNNQSHNDSRAEKALDSLEGIQRAEPQPFFYTRLRARFEREEKNVWETIGSFLARPAVAVGSLCLILALNVFILTQKETTTSPGYVSDNIQPQEDDNIFASANTYDYENLEP